MLHLSHPVLAAILVLNLQACVSAGSQSGADQADSKLKASPAKSEEESDLDFIKGDNVYIDPKPALGNAPDDFTDLDKREAQYQKDATVESDDAKVERELREIHDAEAKANAEQEKTLAAERRASQKHARDSQPAVRQYNREELKEASRKAKRTPGIDSEELEWRGLEN